MAAALLHASWNAIVKRGGDRVTALLILTLVQGGLGLAVALTRPWPAPEVWRWLALSALFHAAYNTALALAYGHGDLSRVYPLARGAAPLMVLAVSVAVLADPLGAAELAGILVLGAGILLMAAGALASGESRRLIPFALASATGTAGYSLVDGVGARAAGDPVAYVGWLFVASTVTFGTVAVAMRGRRALIASRRQWRDGTLAALGSYAAYAIAVWAMTVAPIALVSALRETAILFAVLIGWLAFGERMDRLKGAAALLIVAGLVLTRL